MKEQEFSLIRVLSDRDAALHERDDAAMDLGASDSRESVEALLAVASDASEHETLQASCGESLGEIWKRQGFSNQDALNAMTRIAREEAIAALARSTSGDTLGKP